MTKKIFDDGFCLSSYNASALLGKTFWIKHLGGRVARIKVMQFPSGIYGFMLSDGLTCCDMPSPNDRHLKLEVVCEEEDETLKIHDGKPAARSY